MTAAEEPETYDRLQVFSYTVETNAPTYRAIMAIFAAMKARYKIQLRADDVTHSLLEQRRSIPDNGIESALDQLVEWGNLVRAHDTQRVATLQDFYRRHYVYRITPAGEAAETAVGAVIEAMHRSGSLQRVMLGAIARRLERITLELQKDTPDPAILFEALFDATRQFESLTENASMFMSRLHEALESTEVTTSAWIAYKQDVIAYLQDFIGELSRSTPQTEKFLRILVAYGIEKVCALAAKADEAPTLDEQEDRSAQMATRLRGVCEWFLGDGIEAATVELLRGAARGAVNRILLVLERLHEGRFRKVNRTADLLQLAEWFAACSDDASAHQLAQTAFGLFPSRHLSAALADPTATEASTSWWDAPSAAISIAMRERGDTKKGGRTARIADNSVTRRLLNQQRKEQEAARDRALATFLDQGPRRLSELKQLDSQEFDMLMSLLDRLLATSPDKAGTHYATTIDGRLRLALTPPEKTTLTTLRTTHGKLVLHDWTLDVTTAARTAGMAL